MNRLLRRPAAVLVALGTVAAFTVATTPAEAADEVYTFPASGVLDVLGKGFGHGHGLSQYGARGRGEAGQTWTTITNFYYPGTSVGALTNSSIVVALTNAGAEAITPIQSSDNRYQCDSAYRAGDKRNCGVALPPASGLKYGWLGGTLVTLPTSVNGRTVSMWGVAHVQGGAKLQVKARTSAGWEAYGSARADGFKFDRSGNTSVRFLDGTVSQYIGRIEVRRTSTTRLIRLNVVPMESYLRGVVPREMPAGWDTDALRAQSVAARTYAANERAANTFTYFDTCDSTSCQVYRGERTTFPSGTVVQAETRTNDAITATAGKVRLYGGAPAYAQFSASNGGYMAAGSKPYLQAGADPYDTYPDWTDQLSRSQVQAAYPAIGTALRVVITARDGGGSWGGRVTGARFEGTSGSQTVTGDKFRSIGVFKSTYLTLVRPDPHDQISAVASGATSADVASRLVNGAVVHRTWTEAGGLGSLTQLGGATGYAPALARSSAGALDVAVASTDKQVRLRSRAAGSSTWGAWTSIGGAVTGRPAAVMLASGYLDVFARGTDGQIWERYRRPNGTWSSWRAVGGGVESGTGPVVVELADRTVWVVVHGTDDQVWVRSRAADGAWAARWTGLDGLLKGDPAAATSTNGRLTVAVRGTNDVGYARDVVAGVPSGGWVNLGGHVLASPTAFAVPGSDRLDVLANGDAGTLMRATRTGSDWSGWVIAE